MKTIKNLTILLAFMIEIDYMQKCVYTNMAAFSAMMLICFLFAAFSAGFESGGIEVKKAEKEEGKNKNDTGAIGESDCDSGRDENV